MAGRSRSRRLAWSPATGCPAAAAREGFALTDKFFDVKSVGNNSFLLLGYRSAMSPSATMAVELEEARLSRRGAIAPVWVLDGKAGWGVGHEGIVYKTDNGGEVLDRAAERHEERAVRSLDRGPAERVGHGDVSTILHTTTAAAIGTLRSSTSR